MNAEAAPAPPLLVDLDAGDGATSLKSGGTQTAAPADPFAASPASGLTLDELQTPAQPQLGEPELLMEGSEDSPRDEYVERAQARRSTNVSQGQPSQPRGVVEPVAEVAMRDSPATLQLPSAAGPILLPAERLTTGPSTAEITVEVKAPEFANVHLNSVFWIILRNTGSADAPGVMVYYPLLKDLEFVESEPAAEPGGGPVYAWRLTSLPVGAEKVIKVKVRPLAKGAFDHAVTVSLLAGGRARTMVRQPQLKVEIRPDKAKPLKGVPVVFDINVTNVGDHPARDVVVQAKLSPGFSHARGTDLVLPIKEELGVAAIAPGESIPLKLEVETTAMGVQTADVVVTSPDLPTQTQASAEVEVVHPDLQFNLEGPAERYPDNMASYRLTVSNQGSAPARQVVVAAQIPTSGRPGPINPPATYDRDRRIFYWSIDELPPGGTEVFTVQVRMGGVGLFTLRAGAKAQGITPINRTINTDIKGISKLSLSVSEPRGVLDVGEESTYEIRIRNEGTKDANNVRVTGIVSDNLQVLSISGADPKVPNPAPTDLQTARFPTIDRLPQGGEVTMRFVVKAVRSGDGTCQVNVEHDDVPAAISQSMITRVTR